MDVTNLSASSVKAYLACPAQWKERWEGTRTPTMSGHAADKGSAAHSALDQYVDRGHHLHPHNSLGLLGAEWRRAWDVLIKKPRDDDYYEFRKMLIRWHGRQDWTDKNVVSTEQRSEFNLVTRRGAVPFVYIIDRIDSRDNGQLRVIDYKSGVYQLDHTQMRDDVQVMAYAAAIWLMSPGQSRYWVVFDYLRGEETGVAFTADECESFYRYFCEIAEQIIDDSTAIERLNPMCRFCVRKHVCATLNAHEDAAEFLDLDTAELVDRRLSVSHRITALTQALAETDELVLTIMQEENKDRLKGTDPGTAVELGSKARRWVHQPTIQETVPPDILAQFASLGIGDVESLADDDTNQLTDEQRTTLRKAIRPGRTKATLKNVKEGPS